MRINLFTNGDCTDINTWSGLPYYFYRNLQGKSIAVRPINLIPSPGMSYRALCRIMTLRERAIRSVVPDYDYELFRTRLYHALANRQLRLTAQRHRDVDLNVFLTFAFSSCRFVDLPVVHYCDRTYEQHLEEQGRTPTPNDRVFMRIDQHNIETADLVLTTGQLCLDFIKQRYRPKRAFCLRTGNNSDADIRDPESLMAAKESSTDILFIGRQAHWRGADILIRAFGMFNERNRGAYTLHLVGIEQSELPEELRVTDPRIRFYGYLDRKDPADLGRYNELLRSARMFVMPMRPGPFPGVIREALLHCTPVIASNVSGGPEILTHEHDSLLVDSLEPHAYAHLMDRLIHDRDLWRRLAWNGHIARQSYTWANTVEGFLQIVRESNLVDGR